MDSRASAWTPREWPFRVKRRVDVVGSQTIKVASADAETRSSLSKSLMLRTALMKSVCPDNRLTAVLDPMFQQ